MKSPAHRSHLFTLRIWMENPDADQPEWRGEVRQMSSGETYYFRDWSTLIERLEELLSEAREGK